MASFPSLVKYVRVRIGAYHRGGTLVRCSTQAGSVLTRKHYIRLERLSTSETRSLSIQNIFFLCNL
jgi:hypothetical protein